MSLNFEKLKAAIHYICEKAAPQPEKFDNVKLNKVLWYSDAYAYLSRGQSITGATYIRKPHGPVAKPNRAALEELAKEKKVRHGKMQPGSNNTYWQDCYDVIAESDKSLFEGVELQIIDDCFKRVTGVSSSEISDRTHGEIWQLAEEGEVIPLYTVFAEELGTVTPEYKRLAMAE